MHHYFQACLYPPPACHPLRHPPNLRKIVFVTFPHNTTPLQYNKMKMDIKYLKPIQGLKLYKISLILFCPQDSVSFLHEKMLNVSVRKCLMSS